MPEQNNNPATPPPPAIPYITELIATKQIVKDLTKKELEQLHDECALIKKSPELLEALTAQHVHANNSDVLQYVSKKVFGLAYFDFTVADIESAEMLDLLPLDFLKFKTIVPVKLVDNTVHVVTYTPNDAQLANIIRTKTGKEVAFLYAPKAEIEQFLNTDYIKKVKEQSTVVSLREQIAHMKQAKLETLDDNTIVQLLNNVLRYSFETRASDIHLEPLENQSLIRFRIDGMLHKMFELPAYAHQLMVMRIKVISRLKTDEHLKPQDGKFRYQYQDETYDVRVSIMPIYYGEKIVMRILKEESQELTMQKIGFTPAHLKLIDKNLANPYGMILATGPTGSGKTTTLYTFIKKLNREDTNIMTIEDPIEYTVPLVNQIEVNESIGLNFATGLKSILRQDPNIVMVGEIRDKETAFISINASLTGHLVLSTLHTNNAASTFVRLLDFGIEPFLIASSVNLVIAQRLIRIICPYCKYSIKLENFVKEYADLTGYAKHIMEKLKKEKVKSLFKGKGCSKCSGTGYSGRMGAFEVLEVNDAIRSLIMKKSNSEEITRAAITINGMTTILDDGIEKIQQGITTFEELSRITLE